MLVMWMNIAFLVCWMPYGIICFFYIFGGENYVSPTVVVIPLLTAKTSVCWNPVLYIAMNPQVFVFQDIYQIQQKCLFTYFESRFRAPPLLRGVSRQNFFVNKSLFFFTVSRRLQAIFQRP